MLFASEIVHRLHSSTYHNELPGAVWSTMLEAGSTVRQDEVLDNRIIFSVERLLSLLFSSVMQMKKRRMRDDRLFMTISERPLFLAWCGRPIPYLAIAPLGKSAPHADQPISGESYVNKPPCHPSCTIFQTVPGPSSHTHNFRIHILFHRLRLEAIGYCSMTAVWLLV